MPKFETHFKTIRYRWINSNDFCKDLEDHVHDHWTVVHAACDGGNWYAILKKEVVVSVS